MKENEDIAMAWIGYFVRLLHSSIVIVVIGVLFFTSNPRYMIYVIILEISILGMWQLLSNKCILTLLEERLTGERFVGMDGDSTMTWINHKLSNLIGEKTVNTINTVHPYIVSIALCMKLLYVHRFAAPSL